MNTRRSLGGRRKRANTALLVISIAVAGCNFDSAPVAPDFPPNVILISIDTLRADHLGSHGYARDTSPNLDRLAAAGVRFSNAFAVASWTLPSHLSILTSLYPHQHGVQSPKQRLPTEIATLAETLQGAGYTTGAVVTWSLVGRHHGFERGFDDFVELTPSAQKVGQYHRGEGAVDVALHWLRSRTSHPFFLFLHLFDPHMDYAPPPPYDEMFADANGSTITGRYATLQRYIRQLHPNPERISDADLERVVALYDGEIRYVDHQVGRLLDELEFLSGGNRTLVVVTSDHGEEHGEHGSVEGHQWTLYDEVLRVPLILRLPDGPSGAVVDALVESIDIAPTILDALRVPVPAAFRGSSLLPLVRQPDSDPDSGPGGRLVFSELARFGKKSAVRSATFKLIHTRDTGLNPWGVESRPGYELYDLSRDPGETKNLYSSASAIGETLRTALERWGADGQATVPKDVEWTADERRRLEALGYSTPSSDAERTRSP